MLFASGSPLYSVRNASTAYLNVHNCGSQNKSICEYQECYYKEAKGKERKKKTDEDS